MGGKPYGDESFVTAPPTGSALRCMVCLDVMRDSVRCAEDHGFCRGCLARALSSGGGGERAQTGRCPICRTAMQLLSVLPNWVLNNMISELVVRCPASAECVAAAAAAAAATPCSAPPSKKLKGHDGGAQSSSSSSSSSEVVVSVSVCEWTGPLQERAKHSEACPHVLVRCLHCVKECPRGSISAHESDECEMKPKQCEWCGEKVDHMSYCCSHATAIDVL